MNHRISAGALVVHDGRLLLIRHARPGLYDFWVAPGGGVGHREGLAEAARREALEEANVEVEPYALAYVEDLIALETRHCKFWYAARYVGGTISAHRPEAKRGFIVEAGWLGRDALVGKEVFPPVLLDRYWSDLEAGFPAVTYLAPEEMRYE